MKILAPAGNFESLKAAVFAGADEVYVGVDGFNARNNTNGFDLQTLEKAVDFAHLFGVKVLLAVNILFADSELQQAVDLVVSAQNIGVDAFIVQDFGLAHILHKNYPDIKLHASTQMGLHNLEGVKIAQKLFGFERVVLARETPLSEIERIKKNLKIEIEYFAQGALCVSFSGNCYLSSYLYNASGNRGRCKQLCRLPYGLLKNGKQIASGFLLSAKDFCMIDRLPDLKRAGVDVIKIEGRARRPFYVAAATKEYYNALHGQKPNIENIKLGFYRDFTPGYFDCNGKIISQFQNHIGVLVGRVEKVNKGKKFNEIFFSSVRKLSAKSTFKIFENQKEKSTISAFDLVEVAKNKYRMTTTQKADVGDEVRLIVDEKLEIAHLSETKKRKVDIRIFAKEGKPIVATTKIGNKTLEILGDVCLVANNRPLDKNEILQNFAKSELFDANIEIVQMENVFLPKQKLNEFRRKVFLRIFESITQKYKRNFRKIKIEKTFEPQIFENFEIVNNLDKKFNAKNIVFSPEIYCEEKIAKFIQKCKNDGKNAFLDIPNFALKKDIEILNNIIEKTKVAIVANNLYAFCFDTQIVVGGGLNVFNCVAANVFERPAIFAEGERKNINFAYMTLRHCPMKEHLNASCGNCPFSSNFQFRMENGKTMKLQRKKLSSCTFYLTD